jgi:hypothetical protein
MSRPVIYEEACVRKMTVKMTNGHYQKLESIKKDLGLNTIGDTIRFIIDTFGNTIKTISPPAEKIRPHSTPNGVVTKTGMVLPVPGTIKSKIAFEAPVKKSYPDLVEEFIAKGYDGESARSNALQSIKK